MIIVHGDVPFQHRDQITICYFHSSMDFDQKSDLDHTVVVYLPH